jgi:hypothetical protein
MLYVFSLVINNHALLKSFGFKYESNFISLLIFIKFYDIVTGFIKILTNFYVRTLEF